MEARQRILVTGATGKVGRPLALALAPRHEVWALARFGDVGAEEALEAAGVTCVRGDLAGGRLDELPDDPGAFSSILHLAVAKTGEWGLDLDTNLGSVIALLHRYPGVEAFVHFSSCEVYDPAAPGPYREDAPLGDARQRTDVAAMRTYSVGKIAAESALTATARALGVPAVIGRLSAPYGDTWGWPAVHLAKLLAGEPIVVHPDRPNTFSLLHIDDLVDLLPRVVALADVPPPVVNLGGSEAVSIEEWVAELGRLVGVTPRLVESPHALRAIPVDVRRMHELVGAGSIGWRAGLARIVASATAPS